MDDNRSPTPFPTSTGAAGLAADRTQAADAPKWPAQNPDANPSANPSAHAGAHVSAPAGTPAAGKLVDFAELDNDTLNRAVEGAHKTIDRVADTAAPYVGKLQDRADHLRQTKDEWSESLRVTVRANPLTAVATAVLVGAVFAKLTS